VIKVKIFINFENIQHGSRLKHRHTKRYITFLASNFDHRATIRAGNIKENLGCKILGSVTEPEILIVALRVVPMFAMFFLGEGRGVNYWSES
jgi:hypothetical protein